MTAASTRQTGEVDPIWLERRKWPDISHYRHHAWPLGEDRHGLWMELKKGDPVYRGDDLLFHGADGGLMLLPRGDASWMAWFPASDRFQLYVDIVSHVNRRPDEITMVDLDFDVVRWTDGRVELLDEDEFVEHRLRYGYPDEVADAAITASQQVLGAVQRGDAPFDGAAARRWAATAGMEL